MVPDLSETDLAYRCSLPKVRKCSLRDIRSSLARSRITVSLDEILKYLSRHSPVVTTYGTCCGRIIVAKNWKYCPFDGAALLDGQPVTLRSRIQDAEQTGMTDYLDQLDAPADPESRPTMNWNMKKLRLAATAVQLTGRSKLTKAELVAALNELDGPAALFDF